MNCRFYSFYLQITPIFCKIIIYNKLLISQLLSVDITIFGKIIYK